MPIDDTDVSDVVATHGPFELRKTSVVVKRPADFLEWKAAFGWCQRVEKAALFWVGELIEYGERVFGEKYAQALDSTEYTEQALKDITYVVRHVAPSRRRDALSFNHHREVAPLPPSEQTKWLEDAEVENLSVQQLRIRIKEARSEAAGHPVELWVEVRCKDTADQIQFAERLRLEGRFVKLKA